VKYAFILKYEKNAFRPNSSTIELTLWWQNMEVSTPLVQKPITGDDSKQAANLHLDLQQKSFQKSI